MIPTSDQVHGNQDSTQCSQFGKHIVDLVVGVRHLDGDLSEIVGVRARQNLLVVVQVLSHGDQMILMEKGVKISSLHSILNPYLNIRKI